MGPFGLIAGLRVRSPAEAGSVRSVKENIGAMTVHQHAVSHQLGGSTVTQVETMLVRSQLEPTTATD